MESDDDELYVGVVSVVDMVDVVDEESATDVEVIYWSDVESEKVEVKVSEEPLSVLKVDTKIVVLNVSPDEVVEEVAS